MTNHMDMRYNIGGFDSPNCNVEVLKNTFLTFVGTESRADDMLLLDANLTFGEYPYKHADNEEGPHYDHNGAIKEFIDVTLTALDTSITSDACLVSTSSAPAECIRPFVYTTHSLPLCCNMCV